MERKLKVVFVTMDEPFYIPKYVENIFKSIGPEITVDKVFALPPSLQKKSYLQTVRGFLSYYGAIVFIYMVALRGIYLVSDLMNRLFNTSGTYHSVKLVCKKFRIAFTNTVKINAKEVLSELETLKPDIIFSLASPQIFGKKIISIPLKGCLNIHSSLLPLYRGMNANFWVLAKGEKVTGVTIHYINPGIDDGEILMQKKIVIEDEWSLHDLYLKAIEVGSRIIASTLDTVFTDRIVLQKNDISKGSYYTFPTRKDVKEFRARRKKFFRYR